jgi:hypothetical protein
VAIRALFIGGGGSSALIFPALQRFSGLRTAKRCFPTPAAIIFPFHFHARHWLWIRLGLVAAAGQTITRTTDEANLFHLLVTNKIILMFNHLLSSMFLKLIFTYAYIA